MPQRPDVGCDDRPARRELCTIVDRDYLPRVLVLYRSLEAAGERFRLFVYGAAPGVLRPLDELELPHLVTIDSAVLEAHDPALAAAREDRSLAEYCYTAKPCIALHGLDTHPEIDRITYVDADVMCLAPLTPLFDEVDAASIALSPHRFTSRWQHAERSHGAFNAGFVSFRRNADGVAALRWWRERCLEWCHLRVEPGRYTDQVYLERMPDEVAPSHVIRHRGVNQGPWNSEGRLWGRSDGAVCADGTPMLLFHFSSMQLLTGQPALVAAAAGRRARRLVPAAGQFQRAARDPDIVWRAFPGFRLSAAEIELLWSPYADRLIEATAELRTGPARGLGVWEQGWRQIGTDILRGSVPGSARKLLRAVHLALHSRARGRAAGP